MITAIASALFVAVTVALVAELEARRRRAASLARSPSPGGWSPAAARGDVGSRLIAALRSRKWARRSLSVVSVVLFLTAGGLLGYPFYTDLYQGRVQGRLEQQLASPELKQRYRARAVETGDSVTRIKIPALGVDTVVVEGTGASALRAGAGHYPDTPLPCEGGNVAIAGHRTTYGRPFHDLDQLRPGQEIILETPVGSCVYHVERDPFVVAPTDFSVVAPTPGPRLTLTTCHPKGSASQRLIVRAALVPGTTQRAAA